MLLFGKSQGRKTGSSIFQKKRTSPSSNTSRLSTQSSRNFPKHQTSSTAEKCDIGEMRKKAEQFIQRQHDSIAKRKMQEEESKVRENNLESLSNAHSTLCKQRNTFEAEIESLKKTAKETSALLEGQQFKSQQLNSMTTLVQQSKCNYDMYRKSTRGFLEKIELLMKQVEDKLFKRLELQKKLEEDAQNAENQLTSKQKELETEMKIKSDAETEFKELENSIILEKDGQGVSKQELCANSDLVREREETVKMLEEELNALRNEDTSLDITIKELKDEISRKKTISRRLENLQYGGDIDSAGPQIESNESSPGIQEQLTRLGEINILRRTLYDLNEKISLTQSRQQTAAQREKEMNGMISKLVEKAEIAERRLNSLKEHFEERDGCLQVLERSAKESEDALSSVKESSTSLDDSLRKLTTESETVEEEKLLKEAERNYLTEKVATHNFAILERIKSGNVESDKKLSETRDAVEERRRILGTQNSEAFRVTQEIDKMNRILKEKQENLRKFKEDSRFLEERMANSEKDLALAENFHNELRTMDEVSRRVEKTKQLTNAIEREMRDNLHKDINSFLDSIMTETTSQKEQAMLNEMRRERDSIDSKYKGTFKIMVETEGRLKVELEEVERQQRDHYNSSTFCPEDPPTSDGDGRYSFLTASPTLDSNMDSRCICDDSEELKYGEEIDAQLSESDFDGNWASHVAPRRKRASSANRGKMSKAQGKRRVQAKELSRGRSKVSRPQRGSKSSSSSKFSVFDF